MTERDTILDLFAAIAEPIARQAAAEAGYKGFEPDACLMNRYAPGTGFGKLRISNSGAGGQAAER